MKITNISNGPKQIWSEAAKEMVFVHAGETVEAEISEAEREAADSAWFSFEDQPLTPSPVVDHETPPDDPQTEPETEAEPAPRPRGRPRKDA